MRSKCVFAVMIAGVVALISDVPSFAQKGKDTPKSIELKGEAKRNFHSYHFEKGSTYRITIKADGFSPVLQVVDKFGPLNGTQFDPQKPNQATMIFTPRESDDYRLFVEFDPFGKVGKGPNTYTINIEKAQFAAEKELQDPLKVNAQTVKLEAGKMYSITVKSKTFEPDVRIMDGDKSILSRDNTGPMFDPLGKEKMGDDLTTNLTFAPTETKEYRIVVVVGPHSKPNAGPLNYVTTILELKADLSITGQLSAQDPAYAPRGGSHKVHEIKLEAGKTYQIDMRSKFDNYLFLEDSTKQVLASDDDGGGFPNARIIFRPTKTDTYRIIATTFARQPTDAGEYTLTVMQNPNAQPFQPFFPPKKTLPEKSGTE